jgi:serine/threonine protein kinase
LKFPKPGVAPDEIVRDAFAREVLAGTMIDHPWVGRIIALPTGRQTRLYTVMPLYVGELLETRLNRAPVLSLEEGRNIAIKLARAAAALHRSGIIHRDIKPDNVILEDNGGVKLIDLGSVRTIGLEDNQPPEPVPGTIAYSAPEMLAGERGTPATDVYALGVTMFRAFTGEYPYANVDATSSSPRTRPLDLTTLRPDLPAWLQTVLGRAIASDSAARFSVMTEFAADMEAGPSAPPASREPPRTLYDRSPVQFWQGVAGILALALLLSLLLHR